MCKVKKGMKLNNWSRNTNTREFLDALSTFTRISAIGLMESKVGGKEAGGGTWIHPEAAIHLTMWLDAHFAVQVIRWTSRFISGDLTLINDMVDRHESVNEGTRVKATVTTAGPDVDRDVHERMHQDNTTNAQLKVRIAKVIRDAVTGKAKLVQVRRELVKAKAHGEMVQKRTWNG